MKIKIIALAVALFSANNALATENISLDMYRQLLPKDSSGQIDYDLHLADKLSLPYHCNIKQDSEGRYEIDLDNCEHHDLDWKKDRSGVVKLDLLGDSSDATMVEHKLWAMAFAQAYVSTMIQMQFGLDKENGTFDLQRPFGVGESFGNYFARNMGPNYFVSKGLQESSLGRDLPAPSEEGDDGVLQIEYPGSAWSELQGTGGGGFPRIFGMMQPKKILDSFSGPARNIIGSAVTSGFYNGSVIGINTGSLPWDKNKTDTTVRIQDFIQGSKDKDTLAMVMSYMYNRGPYSVKELLLKSEQSFQHCMALTDHLESDPACFVQLNDFGTRYIRQIPYVTQMLNEASLKEETRYETQLTRLDVSNYVDLLARYGFYSNAEMAKAKPAAMARFDELAKNGEISWSHDFAKVLEALMVELPVTQFAEKSAIDESLVSTLTNSDDQRLFLSVADNVGTIVSHDWLEPNAKIALMPGSQVQQAAFENGAGMDCATLIQDQLSSLDGAAPVHIFIQQENGQCSISQEGDETPSEKPGVPQNVQASNITTTTVTLSWKKVAGDVARYQVYRNGELLESPQSESFTDSNLKPGTAYVYQVAAELSNGLVSELSASLNVKTLADDAEETPAPGDVTPWAEGTVYKAGDRVSFNGKTYSCLQAHSAIVGWDPVSAPALWKLESAR
ncbi:Chitodextrinase [Kosakonia sacchari]|nr:Chitodextrinase [Kosakonia sacchari]